MLFGIALVACSRPVPSPAPSAMLSDTTPLTAAAPASTAASIVSAAAPSATLAASPSVPPATAIPSLPPQAAEPQRRTPTPAPPLSGPSPLGRVDNFSLVGQADLGRRGWNAGLALAFPCAYVGNRRLPQVAIVDVRDPAAPVLAAELTLAPGSQPVELRAVPDLGLLVILNFSRDLTVLTFDISDCARPRPLGALALGAVPHEFFLWRDPAQPRRLLLYAAMWNYQQPDLQVVELSDPANPRRVGVWTAASAGAPGTLHSLSLSPDGQTAYLALWDGGFVLADASDFALDRPSPELRPLRAAGARLHPLPGLNVHSAVPLADAAYVLLTQEVYGCPFAGLLIAEVFDPAQPSLAGRFGLPENDPACGALPQADAVFTAHNPLVVGDLAFVTWYGGGLQAFDLSDPAQPRRVGVYVPSGAGAAAGSYVGGYPAQLWSYPILDEGLLYVADIQSGLHILRYTGPGSEAVAAAPRAESNVTVLP